MWLKEIQLDIHFVLISLTRTLPGDAAVMVGLELAKGV